MQHCDDIPMNNSALEDYFEKCINFFTKYQYLVNTPNTYVLVFNILDNIDISGLENIDFLSEDFKPSDLRERSAYINQFVIDLEQISVEYDSAEDKYVETEFEYPIGEKKGYEVVKLAEEVEKLCREHHCDTVVDFGSGLGYLDQRLHQASGLKVLGVEADAGHLAAARNRQKSHHPDSEGSVVYVQHTVEEGSAVAVEGFLKDHFPGHGPVCVTGLHACGDLTVDGISVFLQMRDARVMILMPCCYHRMEQSEALFRNFPLSAPLKRLVVSRGAQGVFHVPFLRVAAHPPRNEQAGRDMVFYLVARAALQQYAWNNNRNLTRNLRKPIKKCDSFESYMRQAVTGFSLVPRPGEAPASDEKVEFDLDEIRSIWSNLHPDTFTRAAIYILLQNWLQPVCEGLVLLDRIAHTRARGVRCWRQRVFSEPRSPRCLALIAVKDEDEENRGQT